MNQELTERERRLIAEAEARGRAEALREVDRYLDTLLTGWTAWTADQWMERALQLRSYLISAAPPAPHAEAETDREGAHAPCDPEIYERGRAVCVMSGGADGIEATVRWVADDLRIPLDWHYVGGRARVLTTADPSLDDLILERLRFAVPVRIHEAETDREGVERSRCRWPSPVRENGHCSCCYQGYPCCWCGIAYAGFALPDCSPSTDSPTEGAGGHHL